MMMQHDRDDSHHVVHIFDYFYHKEHLFIVCELLRDNLYEFARYNRETGGEPYFTLPRLRRIAKQCQHSMKVRARCRATYAKNMRLP